MTSKRDAGSRALEPDLDGVLRLEPTVFRDHRGSFRELFNQGDFETATGLRRNWVQDNHSRSEQGVLRGIHYQVGIPQAKLVSCVAGEVFDVAVDLRRSSPAFGRWTGITLSEQTGAQMWIPEGFGHGFLVLSQSADVVYKVTAAYDPEGARSLAWNDSDVGIEWPLEGEPILSLADRTAPHLAEAETYP